MGLEPPGLALGGVVATRNEVRQLDQVDRWERQLECGAELGHLARCT